MEDEAGLTSSSETCKHLTFAEAAEDQCAYYMAIGVPYDEFWFGDYTKLEYYRKADEIKRERKNYELWLQGAYIYDALCAVSPILHAFAKSGTKPIPYLDKPYEPKKQLKPEEVKAAFLAKWKADKDRLKAYKQAIS